MSYKILAINPGSTTTKFAVYQDEKPILIQNIEYNLEDIKKYSSILEQYELRKSSILDSLEKNNIKLEDIDTIVGRCGGLLPVKSGAYLINDKMIERITLNPTLDHASNLGALIAYSIAKKIGVNSYIYDPVCVDEIIDIARPSGLSILDRHCLTHALNTRAMAIKYAKSINKEYKDLNLIVAHIGGGISLNIHQKGRIIDFISDEEGPFSPERAGRLPTTKLIDLCYSNKFTHKEMKDMVRCYGGIVSYLNTINAREIEERIKNNDYYAKLIYDAMILQIAKGIGELSTVTDGNVDAIILTGGLAYSNYVTDAIEKRVKFISKVVVMPGENELEALAYGGLRVLRGEEEYKIYEEI